MARHQRDILEEGGFFHIYNKVISEVILFKTDDDYLFFLEKYGKYLAPYFDTYAYCLIPNHFHFLIRVREQNKKEISKEKTVAAKLLLEEKKNLNYFLEHQLGRMFSCIAIKYNNKYSRTGPLFKTGVKRVQIFNESRILYQLYYIHHNPIHHGLVKNYIDWKYSSYFNYFKKVGPNIQKDYIMELIGTEKIFFEYHESFKQDYPLSSNNVKDW